MPKVFTAAFTLLAQTIMVSNTSEIDRTGVYVYAISDQSVTDRIRVVASQCQFFFLNLRHHRHTIFTNSCSSLLLDQNEAK